MQETTQSVLGSWDSFYVIVGSSGAALTGLQFVVIALAAETRHQSDSGEIDAYATPTVVHFCVALFIAAVLSAPWPRLDGAAIALGFCALFGVGYVLVATRRAVRQTGYAPVLEDWLWHTALPLAAYLAVLGASLTIVSHTAAALFALGASALLLLFIGIHNAWDTVTFLTLSRLASADDRSAGALPVAAPPSAVTTAAAPNEPAAPTPH